MTNRNLVKSWFITFPQWTEHVQQELFDKLQNQFKGEYAHIVKETHEDGQPHFHYAFKHPKGYTKSNILKMLSTLFPNDNKRIDVQALKSWTATFTYFSKEQPPEQHITKGKPPIKQIGQKKPRQSFSSWIEEKYRKATKAFDIYYSLLLFHKKTGYVGNTQLDEFLVYQPYDTFSEKTHTKFIEFFAKHSNELYSAGFSII